MNHLHVFAGNDDSIRCVRCDTLQGDDGQCPATYPYRLTLSYDERQAIDFAGYRYNHGDRFYCLLLDTEHAGNWYDYRDITFYMDEHEAWEIAEMFADDEESGHPYLFDLFAPSLVNKIRKFLDTIV